MRKVIVQSEDNSVLSLCKFLDLIPGVFEYEVVAEELGTIDKQTTNSRVMPCPFHNTTDKTCYLVLHNGCKDSACLISAARA